MICTIGSIDRSSDKIMLSLRGNKAVIALVATNLLCYNLHVFLCPTLLPSIKHAYHLPGIMLGVLNACDFSTVRMALTVQREPST